MRRFVAGGLRFARVESRSCAGRWARHSSLTHVYFQRSHSRAGPVFFGPSAYGTKYACSQWERASPASARGHRHPMAVGRLRTRGGSAHAECHGGHIYSGEHGGQRLDQVGVGKGDCGVVQCRTHGAGISGGFQYPSHCSFRGRCCWHCHGIPAAQTMEHHSGCCSGRRHYPFRLGTAWRWIGTAERRGVVSSGDRSCAFISVSGLRHRRCGSRPASIQYRRGDGLDNLGRRRCIWSR